jgi:hypothetical protein
MTMMSGIVEATSTKEVTTKFGVKPTYSMKVEGKWVKCGFKNPGVNAGDNVDFDAVAGTYGLETKSVNILSRAGAAATVASGASTAVGTSATYSSKAGSFGGKVFPIPALHGDRSIVRQNALARATELYVAARGGKPFDLDKSNLELIIGFARTFESYTAGDIDLAEAMGDKPLATGEEE